MATEYKTLKEYLFHTRFAEFSADETKQLERQWMSIFAKNKQGANVRAYKWHIFSCEHFPSLEGEKALDVYKKQQAADFIILPNETDLELAIKIDILPDLSEYSGDYYIFPPNLAWTMAFTHEDGWYGPYFAKHPHYDLLVVENIKNLKKNVKKNIEIEMAKKKGWM